MVKAEVIAAYNSEMTEAFGLYKADELERAFGHLERAHILGQRYFFAHLRSHWWMLKIGIRKKDYSEIFGQLTRVVAVIPGYVFGWVPKGNTGGANVSPVKPMAIPDEFRQLLESYSVMRDVAWRFGLFALVGLLVVYVWR